MGSGHGIYGQQVKRRRAIDDNVPVLVGQAGQNEF